METMDIAGGFFFLVWLVFVIGGIVGYIVMIVALWRMMKAVESIDITLKEQIAPAVRRQGES